MKYIKSFLIIILTTFSFFVNAQDSSMIKWNTSVERISANNFKIKYVGSIKKDWHLYATENTTLEIEALQSNTDDSAFILSEKKIITASKEISDEVFNKAKVQVIKDSIIFYNSLQVNGKVPAIIPITLKYSVANGLDFVPEEAIVKITTGQKAFTNTTSKILIPTIDIEKPLTNCKTSSSSNGKAVASKGFLSIFILGFLGGLIALLTPCVFPMIPLTVSFFTKKAQSKKRGIINAFLYGFFIFLIYVLVTLPFHIFDKLNADILNNISTNVYLNIVFFIIFVVFALSFFGLYEITLPSSITNKTDSKANAGNISGIFFMALTLTIVSFSCTGPLAGSLLAGAASGSGGAMRLSFGMAGFGVALGLPFALFAMFPNMLNALPKSGGWLNTVKVVLGFLELGFAFKFLSNADLVMHWGILKREIFIGIWIIIGAFLTGYLWGIFKFKHDALIKKLSLARKIIATFFTAFTIYLLPGVTNTKYANLSLISGFPPPLYYSIYNNNEGKANTPNANCVLNLNCSHDYDEGLKMAKEQHKIVLLDFTGYACVNCRRMEENVWSNESVYSLLKEKFIVVSLYVDDKKALPSDERFTYTFKNSSTRDIKTVGDKWSVFETENFKSNSQPWYAVINEKEELLNFPCGYTPSVQEYLDWLHCAVSASGQ